MPKRKDKRKEKKKQKPEWIVSPLITVSPDTPAEILVEMSKQIKPGAIFHPHPNTPHDTLVEMSKVINPGVNFHPDPNTPYDTLVAMSKEIKPGVIFHPHPNTPHDTLVEMSKVINPGVNFHPDPNTPYDTLVAMSKEIKPGVIFHPHPNTPHKTLVAMSKEIKPGVIFYPNSEMSHNTLLAMSEVINQGVEFISTPYASPVMEQHRLMPNSTKATEEKASQEKMSNVLEGMNDYLDKCNDLYATFSRRGIGTDKLRGMIKDLREQIMGMIKRHQDNDDKIGRYKAGLEQEKTGQQQGSTAGLSETQKNHLEERVYERAKHSIEDEIKYVAVLRDVKKLEDLGSEKAGELFKELTRKHASLEAMLLEFEKKLIKSEMTQGSEGIDKELKERAESYKKQRAWRFAALILDSLLERHPDDEGLRVDRVDVNRFVIVNKAKDYEERLNQSHEDLQKIMKNAGSKVMNGCKIWRCELFRLDGELDKALVAFNSIDERRVDKEDLFNFYRSRTYLCSDLEEQAKEWVSRSEIEKAIERLDQALGIMPKSIPTLVLRGVLSTQCEEPEQMAKGIKDLEAAISIEMKAANRSQEKKEAQKILGNATRTMTHKGEELRVKGELDKAEQIFSLVSNILEQPNGVQHPQYETLIDENEDIFHWKKYASMMKAFMETDQDFEKGVGAESAINRLECLGGKIASMPKIDQMRGAVEVALNLARSQLSVVQRGRWDVKESQLCQDLIKDGRFKEAFEKKQKDCKGHFITNETTEEHLEIMREYAKKSTDVLRLVIGIGAKEEQVKIFQDASNIHWIINSLTPRECVTAIPEYSRVSLNMSVKDEKVLVKICKERSLSIVPDEYRGDRGGQALARCNSEIYAVRKPGEIPLLFWHAKGLILMRQNQFNEACEQFDLVIEKTKDIPLYKPQYDQARKIRILAKFYQQMSTKFKWKENSCIKKIMSAQARKRGHDEKYEFEVGFEGSKDIDFYQNMFSKQIDKMNKEVQGLDAECQCIEEKGRYYLIITANVDPELEKKYALDFYQWLRPNLGELISAEREKKENIFHPDPNTPHATLVAMSSKINSGECFHPHPDTPHDTLVAMSEVINPGVIFHPHVETPRPTLVAMIKVMKPGVYILKWTGEKVEISEIMSDQDRLDIVGAGHREESAEQEKPGEQSFFRGEHSETMISPSHR